VGGESSDKNAGLDLKTFFQENETFCEDLITLYTSKVRPIVEKIENDRAKIQGLISNPAKKHAIDDSGKAYELLDRLHNEFIEMTSEMESRADEAWKQKWLVVTVNPTAARDALEVFGDDLPDDPKVYLETIRPGTSESLETLERLYNEYAYIYHELTNLFADLLTIEITSSEELGRACHELIRLNAWYHERNYYDSKVAFLFLTQSEYESFKNRVEALSFQQMHKSIEDYF
jgi:hypothetical protein